MRETVFFQADGIRLHGVLHLPNTPAPAPLVIGCHGMLSTGESPKQQALAERCNALGIAYFRFDHRGCGKSGGDFAAVTSFDGRRSDLRAAIEKLKGRPDLCDSLGLFGSSLGGAIVLSVAGLYDTRAVATLAAPVRFSAIRVPLSYETDPALDGMEKEQMVFDISQQISNVGELLICHGDADQVVPYENAAEIHDSAAPPKKLVCLRGADHPLSRPEHQRQFMQQTVDWFKERLVGH